MVANASNSFEETSLFFLLLCFALTQKIQWQESDFMNPFFSVVIQFQKTIWKINVKNYYQNLKLSISSHIFVDKKIKVN